jgi:hypothetical protein
MKQNEKPSARHARSTSYAASKIGFISADGG